jgi:hypothetical protein
MSEGETEMGREGDGERGRWGEREMGREGDGERGRIQAEGGGKRA